MKKGGDDWVTVASKKKDKPKTPAKAAPLTLEEICNGRSRVMIILRGLPGSGKSTLVESLEGGWICSADDFFLNDQGKYVYDGSKIGEAHAWAQEKAMQMLEQEVSPIIVDNTNTMCWEARAYVEPAVARGYEIEVLTPSTSWAFDVAELARRNRHGVPEVAIRKMLQRWEEDFTVEKILKARPPSSRQHHRPPNHTQSAPATVSSASPDKKPTDHHHQNNNNNNGEKEVVEMMEKLSTK